MKSAVSWAASLCVLCLALFPFQQALSWTAELINQAEYWRLLTGHLVHSNSYHLGGNLIALCLISLIAAQRHPPLIISLAVCSYLALVISAVLFLTSYQDYVGLSAVLHGWLFWLMAKHYHHLPTPLSYAVLAGVVSKVILECLQPSSSTATALLIGRSVAVEAHAAGVAAAMVLLAGDFFFNQLQRLRGLRRLGDRTANH